MGEFVVLCRGMRPWMEQQLVPERIRVSNPKRPRKQADTLRSNTQLPANVLSVLYEEVILVRIVPKRSAIRRCVSQIVSAS